jgi:hypothetical protein
MTCINDIESKRRLSAKLVTGLAISAVLVLGTLVAPANAQERRGWGPGWNQHYNPGPRNWGGGGYYPPPPVVYGAPYYAPPPVVYGPGVGIGIEIPGINVNIR